MTRKGWLIAGLVAVLLAAPLLVCVVVSAGAIVWARRGAMSFGDRDPELPRAHVEAYLGTALPASTKNLLGHQQGFQDGLFHARFEIDPLDATAFVDASSFAGASVERANNPFDPPQAGFPAWWDPELATTYEWYERRVPGAQERLLLDRSSPARTIVYWQRMEF